MKIRKTNLISPFFLAFILTFLAANVFAEQDTTKTYYQPIQDVFNTELVYPQEKNEVQLTIMPEFLKPKHYSHLLFPFIAEYGITDSWQIEFEWTTFQNYKAENYPSVNGIGDLEIGTMYSFMNIGRSDFHMATGFDIGIPTGNEDKGLGEGNWEFEPFALAAIDFPELRNLQLFTKAGFSFALNNDEEEEFEDEKPGVNLGAGFFLPLNKLVFVSEINWYNEDEINRLYYTPGIILNLPGGWETGIGMPVGLNKYSENFSIKAILTFEFNLGDDDD